MAIAATQFNIFQPPTQKEVSVGYISSVRGFVDGVSLCEANDYEKEHPNTAFILRNRESVKYLGIDDVNALTPDAVESESEGKPGDPCSGEGAVDFQHRCSDVPQAHLYGGGGVGAFANPVIGEDGGLLTLDIVAPGFGYQYPPKVEVKDQCGIGKGAVVRVGVSDGDNCVESWKYYKDELDENQPEICDDTSIPYGKLWGVDGEDLGAWDPEKYSRYAEDPLMSEIDKYLENLKNLKNPWWNSQKELNKQHITWSSNGEVTTIGYGATAPGWSDFMNLYGISPVEPSDEIGSAHGGETFDFKWDIDFPWGGQYIFRGLYDGDINSGDLYVDNQKVASLNAKNGTAEPVKYEVGIATTKTVTFKLHNEATTKKAPIQPKKEPIIRKAGGKFIREGKNYFYKVSGNDLVDIDFDFFWDKSINGKEKPKPTIPEKVQAKFQVYTSGGGDGLKFRFTAADGSHSFEINSDKYVHNAAAKDLFVNVKPNIDYNIVSSRRSGTTEQGCLKESRFGRSGKEQDKGSSKCIFCDKVGSRDDDDDLQVKTTDASGIFTAGASISSGSSKHDSWALTYRYGGVAPVDNTPKERPAITKLIIQTEKDPLVFEIPKTDSQPANTAGGQKAWVPLQPYPYVYPSDTEVLTDQWHIGEWHINITTPGNYTLEARADDRCKASWDGNTVFTTRKYTTTTIANVSAGTHKLSVGVWNKGKYGSTWKKNPGALRWFLKDPNGTVVANSRDPFNDSKPSSSTGKGGKDWQQKGNISKKGNFKNGRKYRVTFDRLPYTKDPEIADTGDVRVQPETDDQKIDFYDQGHRKGNTLQIITPKNVIFAARNAYQLSKADSRVVYPANVKTSEGSVFNTLKYIDKADRRLWKTNNQSGLLSKYGIAPFDTNLSLPNMPYGGNHTIIWSNINFPVSTIYNIDVHVDDEVRIQIGDQVDFLKKGFTVRGDGRTHTGQSTHPFFIKAGTYTITTTLYQWDGVGGSSASGSSNQSGDYTYVTRGDQGVWGFDKDDNLSPGHRPRRSWKYANLADRYNWKKKRWEVQRDNGKWYPSQWEDHDYEGWTSIPAPPPPTPANPAPAPNKGGRWATTNPMGVAIDIRAEMAFKTVPDPKSWNQNPMGVALTIEAPPPSPPPAIVPPVLEEGECPESPIWHTRMKTDGAPWYPVKFGYWHKWTNKYAISPIPPLNSPGSDGTGNQDGWKQTWTVDAPYEGDYTLKGTVDNFGIIEVDGVEVASRNDDPNIEFKDEEYKRASLDVVVKPKDTSKNKWPQETKVYLSEGSHTISATIANYKNYETKKKFFKEKVFSTKDWQSAAPVKSSKNNKPHGIMFTQQSGKYYLNAYGNDIVDADLAYVWDALEGDSPPPPPPTAQATFFIYRQGTKGMVFTFTAKDGSHTFKFDADALTGSGDTAKEVKINNVKTNVDYVVQASNKGKSKYARVEQGLLDPNTFGKRGTEQDSGQSKCIFADATSSSDDDDDIQIKTTNISGVFTAGAAQDIGTSKHDSWEITYRLSNLPGGAPNYTPPSVTKITIQTEKNPLIFEVPKTDAIPASVTGPQKAWVRVGSFPGVFPSNTDTLGNQWQTGEWTVNITTPGNYTMVSGSDDRCKIFWDGNQVHGTARGATRTIANVTTGVHKLKGQVYNKAKYGTDFKKNPGQLRWTLTDPSGTEVANSADPFAGSNPTDNLGKGGDQWKVNGTIKKRGSWKAGKKYEVTFVKGYGRRPDGGAIINVPDPTIRESGWKTKEQKAIKPNPLLSFKNPWDRLETVDVFQMSSATAVESLIVDNTRNGVTYSGPALFNYRDKRYGPFMNENGISPDYPKVGGSELVEYSFTNVNFPVTGEYDIIFQNDHSATLYLDDKLIGSNFFKGQEHSAAKHSVDMTGKGLGKKVMVNKGKHTLTVKPTVYTEKSGGPIGFIDALFRKPSEDYYRGSAEFLENPSAFAIGITRLVEDVPEVGTPAALAQAGKSWYQNPIGLCAILIPPPCKQIKCGKGRIIDPLVDDPGCGYKTPTPPKLPGTPEDPPPGIGQTSYNVQLVPTEVVVLDPGINYNKGSGISTETPPGDPEIEKDEIYVENFPDEWDFDWDPGGGGGIERVKIKKHPEFPPPFTPVLRVRTSSGVNFRGVITWDIIRDPIVEPDKLIQVTDLVGLKQTGYIQGRAYYGSIYYKDGIPYAGITETAGTPIQVYATLQESIDSEVTTRPSAIQRQGTDVTSNDPRLNLPGTPDNLT